MNRESELAALKMFLDRNRSRSILHDQNWSIVLTAQEMGTGKTALAQAFADRHEVQYIYVSWERIAEIQQTSSVIELQRLVCKAVASAAWTQLYGRSEAKRNTLATILAKSPGSLNAVLSSIRVSKPILLHFDESDLLLPNLDGKPRFYHVAEFLAADVSAPELGVLCYFSGRSTPLWKVGRNVPCALVSLRTFLLANFPHSCLFANRSVLSSCHSLGVASRAYR